MSETKRVIVQLTAAAEYDTICLFALDNMGQAWYRTVHAEWQPLTNLPQSITTEEKK